MRARVALLVLALAARAYADQGQNVAAAEALYVEGTQLMNAGKLAEACPKLAESMRLDASIGTALYLADCYEKTQRFASAWATFREAQDMAMKAGDSRVDVAKRRADRLEPSLAKLTVVVPASSETEGLEVIRDQVVLGRPQWSAAVPVDPGSHVVRARAPHKKEWQTSIDIRSGPGNTTVTVPALVDAPDEPSPPPWETPRPIGPQAASPPEKAGNGQRIAGLAITGVGVVAAVVGLVIGVNAKAIYNASNAENDCTPDNRCDDYGTMRRQHAFDAARVSTITTIAGGVVAGVGLALFLTAPQTRTPVAVKASASSVLLDARF